MTTPPPGSGPDDEHPPAGPWQPGPPPPPGYPYGPPQPPPGYPYYPGQPPPGYPYGPPQPRSRIAVGMVFVGSLVYFAINLFVGLVALGATNSTSANTVVGGFAVLLALIAFGGGAALLASRNRYAKGVGLGLMIGWALTSLFTVGFCTGINPTMYTSA